MVVLNATFAAEAAAKRLAESHLGVEATETDILAWNATADAALVSLGLDPTAEGVQEMFDAMICSYMPDIA